MTSSTSSTSSIEKKVQEKASNSGQQSGDNWGGFFSSLGVNLLTFVVITILGINVGYIMKRQEDIAKVPVDENAPPYQEGSTTAAHSPLMGSGRGNDDEAELNEVAKTLMGGGKGKSSSSSSSNYHRKHRNQVGGGASNIPLSIAYLGSKTGQISQSWTYKEAKNSGSLSWMLWEWFRNSASFSWMNSRGALKSAMNTLNESANEFGVLTAFYVLMLLWPLGLLVLFGVIAVPYLISLAGVLMTTFTKWTSIWQLGLNLILTFMLQGITLVPPLYATGEILALIRYLTLPIMHTVMVGGSEQNQLWHQLKENYMIVWLFIFVNIGLTANSNLSGMTTGIMSVVMGVIYLIMLIQNRLAARST